MAVAALLLSSWTASAAAAAGRSGDAAKFDRAVQKWLEDGDRDRGRVIVRVTPGERGRTRAALRAAGFVVKAEHPLIDAITLEVPRAALEGLSHNPNIMSISLDAPTRASQTVALSGQTLRATLGLSYYSAPRGSGVGIAILDSGIMPSSVFGSRITAFYDFTSGTARAATPTDPYGHGTHVAGLAAGSGTPSGGVYPGVASSASLIGLRVLDGLGEGYTSTVISAIEFATVNRAQLGIDVVNLSLGHPIFEPAATDPLVQAVEAAARAGLVVVVSAGNFGKNPDTGVVGYGGITSPGNAPSAITVGAIDTKGTETRADDAVTAYSSRGPTWYDGQVKPDIVAPGHALTAVSGTFCKLYQDYPNARVTVWGDSNQYLRLNGTSMAAGVVSGVVAAMIEAHRDGIWWNSRKLSPNGIKAILQFTALPVTNPDSGSAYDELTQGTGEVNGRGAVRLAQAIDASDPLGAYWLVSQQTPYSTIAGQTLAWSQHLVWGSHLVWGNAIYYHDAAWDLSEPWGTLDATHLVWGNIDPTHLVWGNLTVWATHLVWGNSLVGTVDGQHIVWGNVVDAEHLVWGNLSAEHLVWGNSVTGNNDPNVVEEDSVADTSADGGTAR